MTKEQNKLEDYLLEEKPPRNLSFSFKNSHNSQNHSSNVFRGQQGLNEA